MSEGNPNPNASPESESSENRLLTRTWSDGEALMVKQLLATYGIPCQVVSDVPHTILPITIDGLGEIRILVPASRLEQARCYLADHLRHGLEVLEGGRSSAARVRKTGNKEEEDTGG